MLLEKQYNHNQQHNQQLPKVIKIYFWGYSMNKQELRYIIREEIELLIKKHPEILSEANNLCLDEGLMDWIKSIKGKIADAFSGFGGKEEIGDTIEADPNGGWLSKIRDALKPSQAYKEMLTRVQEIVYQMDSTPPTTGLELVTAGKKIGGDILQEETSFEKRIAKKRQKPNFLSYIATVMMIISFFSDKTLLVSDMWWVVICASIIGISALSKIMVGMAKGKTNFNAAKMQMAQHAGLQPSQLQNYINSKTSAKFKSIRGR